MYVSLQGALKTTVTRCCSSQQNRGIFNNWQNSNQHHLFHMSTSSQSAFLITNLTASKRNSSQSYALYFLFFKVNPDICLTMLLSTVPNFMKCSTFYFYFVVYTYVVCTCLNFNYHSPSRDSSSLFIFIQTPTILKSDTLR